VAGSCEHGNELWGCIKIVNSLGQLRKCQLAKMTLLSIHRDEMLLVLLIN
jgi:hypothetical protein